MAESSENPRLDSASIDTVNKEVDTANTQEETTGFESSKDELENTPLLPRKAWNSQLAYLKAILKAKQSLDRAESFQVDKNQTFTSRITKISSAAMSSHY